MGGSRLGFRSHHSGSPGNDDRLGSAACALNLAGWSVYFFSVPLSIECFSQAKFENTLLFDEISGYPKADLSVVAWITGHWRGGAFGVVTEEIWTPPLGGSKMAAFKLSLNNRVKFYELETISEQGAS